MKKLIWVSLFFVSCTCHTMADSEAECEKICRFNGGVKSNTMRVSGTTSCTCKDPYLSFIKYDQESAECEKLCKPNGGIDKQDICVRFAQCECINGGRIWYYSN